MYDELFKAYSKALNCKCDTIMWVVLDTGHRIMMIEKWRHEAMVSQLLASGDRQRLMVAEEVMRRTLGTW